MNKIKQEFHFRCHASPVLWVCFILGTCLFLSLAKWQLHKGLIKQAEINQQFDIKRHSIFTLDQAFNQWQLDPLSINDLKITLYGALLSKSIILHDNRIFRGAAGYHVYSLFKLKTPINGHDHILVNLGWTMVPNYNRKAIPNLKIQWHQAPLNVVLEHINPDVFALENMTEILQKSPQILRVQKIDVQNLEQLLQVSLLPLVARSQVTTTTPSLPLATAPLVERGISAEKHFGYSAQWFIFWLISIGIFLYTQCTWYGKLQK